VAVASDQQCPGIAELYMWLLLLHFVCRATSDSLVDDVFGALQQTIKTCQVTALVVLKYDCKPDMQDIWEPWLSCIDMFLVCHHVALNLLHCLVTSPCRGCTAF
jgi:hypothetical protein